VLSVEIDKNLLVMPYTFQLACHQEVISMVTLMLMVAMLVVSTHFGAYDYHHHRINDDCHVRPYLTAEEIMIWEESKCPYLHSLGRKMSML
jgi:hypothetical protein